MKNPPKDVQAIEIFKHADAFFSSIDQLHRTSTPQRIPTLAAPLAVLSAFASELFMKCLMFEESGKLVRGHYLHDIFQRLSPETQTIIEEQWDAIMLTRSEVLERLDKSMGQKVPRDLRSCLKEGNKGFEQIRYLYEGGEDFRFLLSDLPRALRQAVLEIKPNWNSERKRTIDATGASVPTDQWAKISFNVSSRILGSDIEFRDGSSERLDDPNANVFREVKTGSLFDTGQMLSNLLEKSNTRKRDLITPEVASEAIENGVCVGKPSLDMSFTKGSVELALGDNRRDIMRIVFDVELTVRSKGAGI